MQYDQEIKKIQAQFDVDLAELLGKYEQDMCDLFKCESYAKHQWFCLKLDYKVTKTTVQTANLSITLIKK